MEYLVYFLISMAIQYLLAPKAPEPKAASLEDFSIPTADENRPIPVIFGTVWVTGANVVWYGHLKSVAIEKSGGWFSGDVTVGYRYYLGIHFAISWVVDSLLQIDIADRTAWTGTASSGTITINKPSLFGGQDKEGGISGDLDVLDGNPSQSVNSYLLARLGSPLSAYRGVFSLVWKQGYIGTNPYLKEWAFKVKRVSKLVNGNSQWYSAKAAIGNDLNPAHIIRECITSNRFGLNRPEVEVDGTSFTAAADTLFTEGFGLSFHWVRDSTTEDFIIEVLRHIDAKLFLDPFTGLWTLQLIRADYDVGTIPSFDETNVVKIDSFERAAIGETVNEVSAVYTDLVARKPKTVTTQNGGNIQVQGDIIAEKIQYPGITKASLAITVCQRDMIARSSPLAKVKLVVDRSGWDISPGDPFKLSWAELGLVEVVFRAGNVNSGTHQDGQITIIGIEDVFGTPTSTYVESQPSGWTDPTNPPVDIPLRRLVELPYWDMQINSGLSAAEIAAFASDFGFVHSYAAAPSGDAATYEVHSKLSGGSYSETGTGYFVPTALTSATVDYDDTTISFDNEVDLSFAVLNDHIYIGEEMCELLTLDEGAQTMTVRRGILDTVPQTHSIGTRIWLSSDNGGLDQTEWADSDVVDVKMLPTTSQGTLDIASATSEQLTLDSRYHRPYPPGKLRINGDVYPATVEDTIDVTWAHRDRTQQLASFTDQSAASIGPEANTSYSINIKDGAGSVIDSDTGITGTSHSFVPAFDSDTVTVELWAVRDGLDSYQTHSFTFTYSAAYIPSEDFTMTGSGYVPSENFNFDTQQ